MMTKETRNTNFLKDMFEHMGRMAQMNHDLLLVPRCIILPLHVA